MFSQHPRCIPTPHLRILTRTAGGLICHTVARSQASSSWLPALQWSKNLTTNERLRYLARKRNLLAHLHDLGFQQTHSMMLRINNQGVLHMVTAGAPTKRTRHVDICYFALLQWLETGKIRSESVPTAQNISDSMTKATGRINFYQHVDLYMGRQPPRHAPLKAPLATPAKIAMSTTAKIAMRIPTMAMVHHTQPHSTHDMREVSALHFLLLHHALCHAFLPPRTV